MAQTLYTALDLITDAFIEIGATAPGESPSAEEEQWGLRKLNDLLDEYQALQEWAWGYDFVTFNLVAGLSPHTIGPTAPSGEWAAPTFSLGEQPAPVNIRSAAQLLNTGSSTVDLPINIRDEQWWARNQVKQIQTNVVTDLYYNLSNPLGSLYFWPVPNAVAPVRLEYWQRVSQFDAITDAIGGPAGPGIWPPGYRPAIKLTLAEALLPGSNREEHPILERRALFARSAVMGNNAESPRISTRDCGMPKSSGGGKRGDFNWFSGGRPGGRPE